MKLLKIIKSLFRKKKQNKLFESERKLKIHDAIRTNIIDSLEFMVEDHYFTFHKNKDFFKIYLNLVYLEHLIDDISPDKLIDIDGEINETIEDDFKYKYMCDADENNMTIH